MKRLAILFFALGCGGESARTGSGVDPTLAVGLLSAEDIDAVCAYGVGLSRPVTCNGNAVQSVTSPDACVDLLESIADACMASVADIEACFEDLGAESDAEVCDLSTPASCGFLGDPSCIDI